MRKIAVVLSALSVALTSLCSAGSVEAASAKLLFRDDFTTVDPTVWIVEAEPQSGAPQPVASELHDANAAQPVYAHAHTLVLDSPRGLTVWLNRRLTGHYEIDFTRTVLEQGGPHDRVSDMNQFWLANPTAGSAAATPFGGTGRLADYDSLDLFYAGIGGNSNTTTRFRHYDGTANRPLLAEYHTQPWLLKGNHPYRIRIIVDAKGTRLYVGGRRYFSAPAPLRPSGYFGFRSTASRQTVAGFSIRALP